MGAPWRDTPSWTIVEQAEAALGRSLAPLLLDPDAALERTDDAQLSVLLASLLAWDAVRDRIEVPVAFAGHSLGQITALIASGALALDDGVCLAAARAECTQAAGENNPGRLAALMGASPEAAEEACAGSGPRRCWVANDNAPGQVVVGGTPDGVGAAGVRARQRGARRVVVLKVAAAFHTPLMEDARSALAPTLHATDFAPPSAPIVSNVDARPHSDGAEWRTSLGTHLVSTVRWRESMKTLVDLGAEVFLELGPGAVLSGLARRTVPHVATRTLSSPAEIDAMPGLRDPNAMPGLRDPNAMPGLRDPNAMPGLRDPNAMPGLRDPNAMPGLRDPNAMPGLRDPNAMPGLRDPNAMEVVS